LPSGVSTVDTLFNSVQTISKVNNSALVPVLPATASSTTTASPFLKATVDALNTTLNSGALGSAPSSIPIVATLILSNSVDHETGSITQGGSSWATNRPFPSVNLSYRDGQGSGHRLHWSAPVGNPLKYASQGYTYTTAGNVITTTIPFTGQANGLTQSVLTTTIDYSTAYSQTYHGSFVESFAPIGSSSSSPNYWGGNYVGTDVILTPVSLGSLTGHTIVLSCSSSSTVSTGTITLDASNNATVALCDGTTANYTAVNSPVQGVIELDGTATSNATIYLATQGTLGSGGSLYLVKTTGLVSATAGPT
jgi:hypothetical protein